MSGTNEHRLRKDEDGYFFVVVGPDGEVVYEEESRHATLQPAISAAFDDGAKGAPLLYEGRVRQ
jgi:uncharacterized cupin superfamily protein